MKRMGLGDDARTLVIPGLNGSGPGHWQWHWPRDNRDAAVVEQDDWTCPDLASWRLRIEAALEQSDGVWIVAHSLGCVLTANLAKSPLARHIRGALLVAPCDLEATEALHPCVLNFGRMPLDPLPFPSLMVASLNDPYMPFARAREVARCWQSPMIDIGEAGHININSGYGRWTAGYDLLALLKATAGQRRAAGQDIRVRRPARAAGLSTH